MSTFTKKALDLLEKSETRLARERGVVGLDGFVDQILRVVDKRSSDGKATFLETIPEWAARIQAAAGRSTKFEMSVQQVKLGGNGPIMAQALSAFGLPLTCVGNLGFPKPHPVFAPMEKTCRLITVAEASFTDAVEFHDGKLMLSRQEASAGVCWENLERVIGSEKLFKLFNGATFLALNNWSALPHMSQIWRRMQEEICPRLAPGRAGAKRQAFFDLADPEFRLEDDIRGALKLIAHFQVWFDTTLGLNQKEAGEILQVLRLRAEGDDRQFVQRSAEVIRNRLGISGVVVHATAFAAAASPERSTLVDGPYVGKPRISTGAGDHFNAGYSLGGILRGDLESCLQLGVATSGFYVRNARPPSLADLRGFLAEIGAADER